MEIKLITKHNEHQEFKNAFMKYCAEMATQISDKERLFQSIDESGLDKTILLLKEGEVIGFIMFRIDECNHWFFKDEFLFLRELWVVKENRNQHLGKQLLHLMEEYATKHHIHKILLTTESESFYLHHGYTKAESYTARNNDPVYSKLI